MEVDIILVRPARPENIGFIARAMKTHGFQRWTIIGETLDLLDTAARKTAYGAHDVLEQVQWSTTLDSALKNYDLSIGTTSKKRTSRDYLIPSAELPSFLFDTHKGAKKVALVFGNEENGLSKQEINLCDCVSTIPLAVDYPSLNLAQSVLVYLYELNREKHSPSLEPLSETLYPHLKTKMKELLLSTELDRNPAYYQKLMDRAAFLSENDTEMIMSVLNKILHRLNSSGE